MNRIWTTILFVFVAVCPAAADPVELPLDAQVLAKKVAVDLRGGQIEVVLDPDATPTLSVSDLLSADNADGFVLLEQTEDQLTIGQPHGDDRVAPRLLVRLVLAPDTDLTIRGEHLSVSVELFGVPDLPDPLAEAVAASQTPATAGTAQAGAARVSATQAPAPAPDPVPAKLRLSLRDSTARLVGVTADLDGSGSRFAIERATGLLRAKLRGGDLRVDGFAGVVDIAGTQAADVVLTRLGGTARYDLDRGNLRVESGAGSVSGTSQRANVTIERWFGSTETRGEGNRIDLRGVGSPDARVQVDGTQQEIVAEAVTGQFRANLEGGRLEITQVVGSLNLDVRAGADVSVGAVRGTCDLHLTDQASARVSNVDKRFSSNLADSRLELDKVREIDIRATSATVVARAVGGRASVRAADSEIDLDLGRTASNPSFDLTGSTRARVELPSPCSVRVNGDPSDLPERLTVTGCDIAGKGRGTFAPARSNAKPTIFAETRLGDTASLDVRSGS